MVGSWSKSASKTIERTHSVQAASDCLLGFEWSDLQTLPSTKCQHECWTLCQDTSPLQTCFGKAQTTAVPLQQSHSPSGQCQSAPGQDNPKLSAQKQHGNSASPPHSPDLAPCDFFLFPHLKRKLKGNIFPDLQSVRQAVDFILGQVPVADYHNSFDQWMEHAHKCVRFQGRYFEGMHWLWTASENSSVDLLDCQSYR